MKAAKAGDKITYHTLKHLALKDPEMLEALRAANRRKLWLEGNLRHLTRPHGQRRLYDAAHEHMDLYPGEVKPLVWLCHRRLGKSFLLLLMCFERAIQQMGALIKYACATRKQVKDIVEPMVGQILSHAPSRILARRDEDSMYFRLPHWPAHLESRISFVGLDYKQGNLLRGQACDVAALDEPREMSALEYVVNQVLAPQFVGRKKPLLMLATTPPESMEHPVERIYCREAEREKTLFVIPASQNEDWTEDDEAMVVKQLGGHGSLAYQREIECARISDTSRTVIPEWHVAEKHVLRLDVVERPRWYVPYISLDVGYKDHCGCLFAYLDFLRQKIVVIGEVFENYVTLGQLAAMIHEKAEELFSPDNYRKCRWIADGTLSEINTLRRDFNCPFLPADKWKTRKDQALAAYRTSLTEGRWEIEGMSCPHTVEQHAYGIWNKQKTSFERTETMGHLDLIAASVYLHNQVSWQQNPVPLKNLRDGEWAGPAARKGKRTTTGTQQVLGNMFGSRFRK